MLSSFPFLCTPNYLVANDRLLFPLPKGICERSPIATRVTGRFGPRASKLATQEKPRRLSAATLFSDVANGTQVNKEAA
jgi:hypothetical protein